MTKITLILISLIWSCPAWASPRVTDELQILKLRSLGYEGDQIRISYSLPCGTEKVGVLIHRQPKESLRIGIVAKRHVIACAKFPQLVTETLPYVDYGGIKEIIKMAPGRFHGKLALTPVSESRLVPSADRWQLQAVRPAKCGVLLGLVVRQEDSGAAIGFLENRERVSRDSICKSHQQPLNLSHIKFSTYQNLRPIDVSRRALSKAYQLKLAKIAPGSFRRQRDGALAFSYRRRCNEAPLGVVMGRSDGEHASVGMLVAHFYNRSCPEQKQRSLDTYTTHTISLDRGIRVRRMKPRAGFDRYKLVTPLSFQRRGVQDQLVLKYVGGCQKAVGVVYATDKRGFDAVGILQRKGRAQAPCKRPLKRVSLKQRFVDHARGKKLYPLSLTET